MIGLPKTPPRSRSDRREAVIASAVAIPERLAQRPRQGGLPILYTSHMQSGVADFRLNDPVRVYNVLKYHKCAICGQPCDTPVFLVGPHSRAAGTTPEPPGHEDCTRYALAVCPYLSRSKARSSRPPHPNAITDVYHCPTLPAAAWLAWTTGYRLTLNQGIWYAVCAPWTKLEAI
jgi:hypothetical protein